MGLDLPYLDRDCRGFRFIQFELKLHLLCIDLHQSVIKTFQVLWKF